MAENSIWGLKAEYLTSKNSKDRDKIRDQFKKKEFNYLFVVDILTKELIFRNRYRFISSSNRESLTVSSTIGERFAFSRRKRLSYSFRFRW
jgi:hypothetical protein